MTDKEKLALLEDAFELDEGYLTPDMALEDIDEYDSMSKLTLIVLMQDEFNKKYEEFLDGQASFPKSILQKRQSELQEMLDKNIAFKKEGQRLLRQAENEAKAPLKQRLAAVLTQLGEERGYAFILNTDCNAVPWLNAAMAEDCTDTVKALLK